MSIEFNLRNNIKIQNMYMDEEQQIKFKALFKIISMQIF